MRSLIAFVLFLLAPVVAQANYAFYLSYSVNGHLVAQGNQALVKIPAHSELLLMVLFSRDNLDTEQHLTLSWSFADDKSGKEYPIQATVADGKFRLNLKRNSSGFHFTANGSKVTSEKLPSALIFHIYVDGKEDKNRTEKFMLSGKLSFASASLHMKGRAVWL